MPAAEPLDKHRRNRWVIECVTDYQAAGAASFVSANPNHN
jgi:hypothetical protein